jgi:hypothetical protein
MTGKLMFFALGYVLGTRAGRERFLQLAQMARWALSREEAQTALGLARTAMGVALERGAQYASKRVA